MDISLKFSDIKLSKSAVFEEMGYGKDTPDERVLKLVDELFRKAEETVKPAFHYQFSDGNLENRCICCDNAVSHVNSTIATLLKHSEKFVFFAATAGNDYQDYHNQLSDSGDSLTLFIWDAIGSCIAEATGDLMEKYLEKELDGIPHTNSSVRDTADGMSASRKFSSPSCRKRSAALPSTTVPLCTPSNQSAVLLVAELL